MTPLLGIGLCVSIQFGALEYAKRAFASQNLARGLGGEKGATLTGDQLFASGVFAGLANGVVSGPVEHIRIRTSLDSGAAILPTLLMYLQDCRHNPIPIPYTTALGMPSRRYMPSAVLLAYTKVRLSRFYVKPLDMGSIS